MNYALLLQTHVNETNEEIESEDNETALRLTASDSEKPKKPNKKKDEDENDLGDLKDEEIKTEELASSNETDSTVAEVEPPSLFFIEAETEVELNFDGEFLEII